MDAAPIDIPPPPEPVRRIERFALAHEAAPAHADDDCRVLLDGGEPRPLRVPGVELLAQFGTPDGFLLVTEHGDPWEVATSFTLLAPGADRVLGTRMVGGHFGSAILRGLEWRGPRRFSARFDSVAARFDFTLRPWPLLPAWARVWCRRRPH